MTSKITRAAASIYLKKSDRLYLGNLDAKRDWGYAKDYVEGMWLMLQQDEPEDYVLATGETHSVREFCELAFQELGYEIEWQGEGANEKGLDKKTREILIEIDPKYFRPTEVEVLWGDFSKAREKLDWSPKTSFKDLISMMVKADLEKLQNGDSYQSKFEN